MLDDEIAVLSCDRSTVVGHQSNMRTIGIVPKESAWKMSHSETPGLRLSFAGILSGSKLWRVLIAVSCGLSGGSTPAQSSLYS